MRSHSGQERRPLMNDVDVDGGKWEGCGEGRKDGINIHCGRGKRSVRKDETRRGKGSEERKRPKGLT